MLNKFKKPAVIIACFLLPQLAAAQSDDVKLWLRPHCEEEPCSEFLEESPSTVKTEPYENGSIIDMDLILYTAGQPVKRVRTWLSYDPAVLLGIEKEIKTNLFSVINSEESDFFLDDGYFKLEVSSKEPVTTEETVLLARLKFKIEENIQVLATAISFYDVQSGGHTDVVGVSAAGEEMSYLEIIPSSVHVILQPKAKEEEGFTENEETTKMDVEALFSENENNDKKEEPLLVTERKEVKITADYTADKEVGGLSETDDARRNLIPDEIFSVLQVQNLRITTEGGTVFLIWDNLDYENVKYYNIYYGTISGQYLHRRSVAAGSVGFTKRALPLNTFYYFAVRAVNDLNQESAFSYEVAVKVGEPASSTSPFSVTDTPLIYYNADQETLSAGVYTPTGYELVQPVNVPLTADFNYQYYQQKQVSGKTGIPSALGISLILTAAIGTMFAFIRQLKAVKSITTI